MKKILTKKWTIASLVAFVTFMVFLPSLRNEFINWDDNDYVYKNYFIRSLDANLLKSAFAEFHNANWHPLTWLSHALDYAIWSLNPLGHHLTNNILHAVNTFLVVLLVVRLIKASEKHPSPPPSPPRGEGSKVSGSPPILGGVAKGRGGKWNKGLLPNKPHLPLLNQGGELNKQATFLNERGILITAAVTGLLFGLHPLHVESVAWVTERKDLLCALFYLLSVMAYMSYRSQKTYRTYSLSLGFFALALLSKPMAVSLPLVLLILDWHLFRRIQSLKTFWTASLEKLPFFALTLISSILTILAQEAGGAMKAIEDIPLTSRMIVAAKSLVGYLVKMILPLELVPFYPYPENISLFSSEYIIPLVIVLAITATCITVMRKRGLWISVWGYYVITLMPVLGIVQVGHQAMADRYTYLPSLGPFLVIGLIFAKVYEKVSALSRWRVMSRMACFIIAMTILASLSYATIKQIGIWKNSIVFWNYVIDKEPSATLAHNNLGDAYISKGQWDMAIEQIRTALTQKPNDAGAYNNLGAAYLSKGQFDMAIEQFQTALSLKPNDAVIHYSLGYAYLSRGQLDKAIEQFQTVLSLKPDDAEAHNNLGNAYVAGGQLDLAIEQYRIALSLTPNLTEVHFNLGDAYLSSGLIDMAIEQYRTTLSLTPDFPKAHYKLGLSYLDKGLKDMARTEFELELKINPYDYEARQALNSITSK